jgi:hypothetical protein
VRDYRFVRNVPKFLAALTVALAVVSADARAQQKLAVLKGNVLTDSSELPIRGAEISVPRLRLTTTTALDGTFRLSGVAPGREIVMVKRIGFMPITTTLNFAPGDSIDTDFLLVPSAQSLPSVQVKGKAFDRKFAEYERRKAEGFGHFLDTEQLDKMQARQMAEVLNTIPGPQIYRSNVSSAAWIASARGQQSISNTFQVDQMDIGRGAPNGQCYAAVFLDGTPVFTAQRGQPLFDINSVPTASVRAIEYYAGAGTMPPEFNGSRNTCGAVVIWTK